MAEENLGIFADRIKELRKGLGLTQQEFASSIHITASALSSYETKIANPSLGVAKKIAEKYDVSIDWLCGIQQQKNSKENTWGDIIRLLISLTSVRQLPFHILWNTEITESGGNKEIAALELRFFYESNSPYSSDDRLPARHIMDFFRDWKKMYNLYTSEIIDKDVYDLWIEKTLKKYDSIALTEPYDNSEWIPF